MNRCYWVNGFGFGFRFRSNKGERENERGGAGRWRWRPAVAGVARQFWRPRRRLAVALPAGEEKDKRDRKRDKRRSRVIYRERLRENERKHKVAGWAESTPRGGVNRCTTNLRTIMRKLKT